MKQVISIFNILYYGTSREASITPTTNDIEKSDSLIKIELQLFEKKCNKLEIDCSNIFDQVFLNCEAKDYDKFDEE